MKKQDTVCEWRILECEGAKAEYCRCCRRAKVLPGKKLVPINIALLLIVGECRTKHRWIAKTNCKDGLIEKGLWAGLRETLQ
jgi:hypothetical protein